MMKQVALIFFVFLNPLVSISQGIATDSIIIRDFGSRDFQAATSSYSMVEDENGILYAANENGILEYDGSEWNLIEIKDFSSAITIKLSPDGKLYVGGINEFGYLERNALGQMAYHSLRDLFNPKTKINEIWQIIFHENQVYFHSYETIIRYDGEQAHNLGIENSWLIPFNDQLLVSTYDRGLAVLEGDSVSYMDEVIKLKDDAPFKILPGPDGKQLALTEYNGAYLLDTTDYSFEKWNVEANANFVKHGLYDGLVWDDSTYLFSLTNQGVVWVSSAGKLLRSYNKGNGLTSNFSREILRDSKGNLWLPSDGINNLKWHDQIKPIDFNTLLRYVEVNDSTLFINANNGQLTIDEYVTSIVFHFATPGYDHTDLEYAYYLEGFEPDWSTWKNDVKKEYTNLSSRPYTFHVKARLKTGEISTPASVQFDIPVRWYENFWTYFFGIILIGVVTAVAIRLRMNHLKMLNVKLEEIIDDRTKKLRAQKEALTKSNAELTLANDELDNFVYRSSHDLVAPLKSIRGLLQITRDEKSADERQQYFDMMTSSIIKLEEFIKSILEYSTNSNGEFESEELNLNDVLNSTVEDLKYFDSAQKVTLKRHFDKEFSFVSDHKRIKIILSNLLANAVKYHNYKQDNPFVEVTASKDDHAVFIDIIDNGPGISEIYLDKIFDMFYRASVDSEGSGLGLYIVKDTVHKLNGEITVTSELEKGTKFSLKFNRI
jgi:signal transduction histidine kinase